MEIYINRLVALMDYFYLQIEKILNLFLPSSFSLFEKLTIFFLGFGVVWWIIQQFKK